MLINMHQGTFDHLQSFNGLTIDHLMQKRTAITGKEHPLTTEQCEYFYTGGSVVDRAAGLIEPGNFIQCGMLYPGLFSTKKNKNSPAQTLEEQLDIVSFIADSYILFGTRPQAKSTNERYTPRSTQAYKLVAKQVGTVVKQIAKYETMVDEIEMLIVDYDPSDDGPGEMHDKTQIEAKVRECAAAHLSGDTDQTMQFQQAENWLLSMRVTRYSPQRD